MLPDSVLARARSILGLAGWIHQAPRHAGVRRDLPADEHRALHRVRVGPPPNPVGNLPAKTRDVHLAMRVAAAGTDAACFSDSFTLNGPISGSSYTGTCIQFSAGYPALPDKVMSGAIWARCLVPPSSGTAPPRRSPSWRPWRPRRSRHTGCRPGARARVARPHEPVTGCDGGSARGRDRAGFEGG